MGGTPWTESKPGIPIDMEKKEEEKAEELEKTNPTIDTPEPTSTSVA